MAMRNDDHAAWLSDVDGRVTELAARLGQVEADNNDLRTDYDRLRRAHVAALRRLLRIRGESA